jgi:hypothetical protein
MPKKIVIIVNPDGTVKHDFIGFAGQDCMIADDALRAKLAELGIQVETTRCEPKPELLHGQETYRPQHGGQREAP